MRARAELGARLAEVKPQAAVDQEGGERLIRKRRLGRRDTHEASEGRRERAGAVRREGGDAWKGPFPPEGRSAPARAQNGPLKPPNKGPLPLFKHLEVVPLGG